MRKRPITGLLLMISSIITIGCQVTPSEAAVTPQYVPIVVAGQAEGDSGSAYPAAASPTPAPPPELTPPPTAVLAESDEGGSGETATAVPASPTITPTIVSTLPDPTIEVQASPTETVTTGSTTLPTPADSSPLIFSLGSSIQGRPLTAYRLNNGPREIVIVGGIHGGYEWNSILLAYELIDHFDNNPDLIPESISLTIIPSANPDGQALVTGKDGRFSPADVAQDSFPGRFNANNVDLNRNWDCQWQPVATWRDQPVNAGSAPFSEPENVILRDYFLNQRPTAVIFLHSAANGVFAAGCPDTHLESMLLAQTYGEASGYPVYERFSSYPITGDAGDWLTIQNIPTMTVELIDHFSTEFSRNLAGMLAVIDKYK